MVEVGCPRSKPRGRHAARCSPLSLAVGEVRNTEIVSKSRGWVAVYSFMITGDSTTLDNSSVRVHHAQNALQRSDCQGPVPPWRQPCVWIITRVSPPFSAAGAPGHRLPGAALLSSQSIDLVAVAQEAPVPQTLSAAGKLLQATVCKGLRVLELSVLGMRALLACMGREMTK